MILSNDHDEDSHQPSAMGLEFQFNYQPGGIIQHEIPGRMKCKSWFDRRHHDFIYGALFKEYSVHAVIVDGSSSGSAIGVGGEPVKGRYEEVNRSRSANHPMVRHHHHCMSRLF